MRFGGVAIFVLGLALPAWAQDAERLAEPGELSPNEIPMDPPALEEPPLTEVPPSDETVIIIDDEGELAPAQPAIAEEPAPEALFAAEYASRLYVDTAFAPTGEDVVEWWNLGRLRLDYRVASKLRAYLEGWIRWGGVAQDAPGNKAFWLANGENAKWATDIQLREGYVDLRLDNLSFKVGQRIYVWGKNELFAAGDVINPLDLRFDPLAILNAPRDAKLPVFAADVTYSSGDYALTLVLVPFFVPNKFFLVGRDFAIAPPGSPTAAQLGFLSNIEPSIEDEIQQGLVGTRLPDESPKNASVALRGTARPLGWDLAATAYFGWDRTPTLFVDNDALTLLGAGPALLENPELLATDPVLRAASLAVQQKAAVGQELVRARYDRLWVGALEAQGVVGDFVVRLDLGASPEQTFLTQDFTSVRRANARATGGVEYTYGETFYSAVTGYTLMVFNPPANQRLVGIEDTNEVAKDRDIAALYGVSATLRYTLTEYDWAFDAMGLYNISPGDLLVTARVGYKVADNQEVGVGGLFVHGPRGTVAYTYRHNDFAYAQYKVTF